MNRDHESAFQPDPVLAFALACRVERDRRACLDIAEEDRRFETQSHERAVAEASAARAIAAAAR
ncbi:MAG TPA: hypothetical protein VFF72_10460 [Caldimonas sp.]|nr:hypothetical protein [Caldimonas sp.]